MLYEVITDGVKKVTSSSVEGTGTVTIEALAGADVERLAQDVKGEVDRITSSYNFV